MANTGAQIHENASKIGMKLLEAKLSTGVGSGGSSGAHISQSSYNEIATYLTAIEEAADAITEHIQAMEAVRQSDERFMDEQEARIENLLDEVAQKNAEIAYLRRQLEEATRP